MSYIIKILDLFQNMERQVKNYILFNNLHKHLGQKNMNFFSLPKHQSKNNGFEKRFYVIDDQSFLWKSSWKNYET